MTDNGYFPAPCLEPGHVPGCPGKAGGDHVRERTLTEYREAMAVDESASFYTTDPAVCATVDCTSPAEVAGSVYCADCNGWTGDGEPLCVGCGGALEPLDASGMCGTCRELDAETDAEARRYEVGDTVRINEASRSAFAGDVGIVSAVFTYRDAVSTVVVRLPGMPGLGFSASQLDLAEVGDRMYDDARRAGLAVTGWRIAR